MLETEAMVCWVGGRGFGKSLGLAPRAMGSHGRIYAGGRWQGLGFVLERNPFGWGWVGAEWREGATSRMESGLVAGWGEGGCLARAQEGEKPVALRGIQEAE